MSDIIITKNRNIKSPANIEEVFDNLKNPDPKFYLRLNDILIVSDVEISDVNLTTLEITWY